MNKKTVVQIIPQLNSGGAERFVVDLCNELSEKHKVILITFFPLETHGFYLCELNKRVKVIAMNKKMGKDFSLLFNLFKTLRIIKPDVVHTHLYSFFYSVLFLLFYPKKVKFIHTIHTDTIIEGPGKPGVLLKVLFSKIRNIDFVSISFETLQSFQKYYHQKGRLIENGRCKPIITNDTVKNEIESYRNTKHTKIFVNIARISPEKNQKMLIDTFLSLISSGHDIVLLIIGSNQDDEIMEYIIANSSNNIRYLGERKDATDFLKYSNAFCLTSKYEGMPITLIESFSLGCIPICTPAGGVKSMIKNRENGLISDSLNLECYKQSIIEFLNLDQNNIDALRALALKSFQKHEINYCSEKYQLLFD